MLLIYIIIFYYICEVGIGGVWNFILFIKVFISSLYGVIIVYLLFVNMLLCEVLGKWIVFIVNVMVCINMIGVWVFMFFFNVWFRNIVGV